MEHIYSTEHYISVNSMTNKQAMTSIKRLFKIFENAVNKKDLKELSSVLTNKNPQIITLNDFSDLEDGFSVFFRTLSNDKDIHKIFDFNTHELYGLKYLYRTISLTDCTFDTNDFDQEFFYISDPDDDSRNVKIDIRYPYAIFDKSYKDMNIINFIQAINCDPNLILKVKLTDTF